MMTIKKLYLIVLLLGMCLSCIPNGIKIDDRILKEISKGGEGVPLLYGNTFVFVAAQNSNEKIMTNLNQLQSVYNNKYNDHYEEFYIFLQDALNQNIVFDINDFQKGEANSFTLSENIQKEYKENDSLFFQKKYLEENDNTLLLEQKGVSVNDLYSVLYYLFINGYRIGYDDYLGGFSVKKW